MKISENISINFSNIEYEVLFSNESFSKDQVKKVSIKKVKTNNNDYKLHIKSKSLSPVSINFQKKFFYKDIISSKKEMLKTGVSSDRHFLCSDRNFIPTTKSNSDVPFYLNLTVFRSIFSKHTCENKYAFIDFFIETYDVDDNKIGQTKVVPNTNILLSEEVLKSLIGDKKKIEDITKISYFKISMILNSPCNFCLNSCSFSFVDYLSSHVFFSSKFNVFCRLQINNLNKKKNGVVVFFPSFYIQERDSDTIEHDDNSIKWPNYTRYTWSRDLDDICTVFISDPFQFVNGNDKSSWFFGNDGNNILSEIALYLKLLFDYPNCGPIINYGSSMGGFAAFLFSCYLEPTLCFSECPQSDLMKYKYSKEYLDTCKVLGINEANSNDLSISAIIRNHKPSFKFLVHFYSLDKMHLSSFENQIKQLSEEEIKSFNYQLVIESDPKNQLFAHQPMPKEQVLQILRNYSKRK